MAKSKQEIEVKEAVETSATTPALPSLGDIVLYHKQVQNHLGDKLQTFAAIVIGYPDKASNLQAKDMGLTLQIFTAQKGGGNEVRDAVLFSTNPTNGRWSFRK